LAENALQHKIFRETNYLHRLELKSFPCGPRDAIQPRLYLPALAGISSQPSRQSSTIKLNGGTLVNISVAPEDGLCRTVLADMAGVSACPCPLRRGSGGRSSAALTACASDGGRMLARFGINVIVLGVSIPCLCDLAFAYMAISENEAI
jgi:hypothetical protein